MTPIDNVPFEVAISPAQLSARIRLASIEVRGRFNKLNPLTTDARVNIIREAAIKYGLRENTLTRLYLQRPSDEVRQWDLVEVEELVRINNALR